jgi:steroid delta-isomerase-like uncharacterized protein
MNTQAAVAIEAFAQEYDRAWNAKDPDAIAAMHAEDGTYRLHIAGSPEVRGREALREAFATSIANWRELDFEFDRALYGESFYVWQATLHGVLENPLELGAVTLPANGVSLAFAGLDVITLTDDGLIESKQTHFDLVAAANQAAQATV